MWSEKEEEVVRVGCGCLALAINSSSSLCELFPSSLRRRVKGVGVWFEKQREVVRGWRVV